jgi:hypothetical protein
MKKVILAFAALAVLCSCNFSMNLGNAKRIICRGDVEKRPFDLTDFEKIVLNGAADLKYSTDETYSVVVEANAEVFQHLNYRVEEGVLILETKYKVQPIAETFDIYVSSPVLQKLTINGASEASVSRIESEQDLIIGVNGSAQCELKDINVPSLTFTVNGAGELDATRLQVGKLYVNVNGAGDVKIAGSADYASFSVAGAGDIDARELDCARIDRSTAGAARIRTKQD